MSDEPRTVEWPLVGAAALAGLALLLPLLTRRAKPFNEADQWIEAYVRGCLEDDHQPV